MSYDRGAPWRACNGATSWRLPCSPAERGQGRADVGLQERPAGASAGGASDARPSRLVSPKADTPCSRIARSSRAVMRRVAGSALPQRISAVAGESIAWTVPCVKRSGPSCGCAHPNRPISTLLHSPQFIAPAGSLASWVWPGRPSPGGQKGRTSRVHPPPCLDSCRRSSLPD